MGFATGHRSMKGKERARSFPLVIVGITVAVTLLVVALAVAAFLFVPQMLGSADASGIVEGLEGEGMAIGEVKAYTPETDPNELMGRPGQYTSKLIFLDTTLERHALASKFDVQNGGSVEVFESGDDAMRRQEYLEVISGSFSPFAEYSYREGDVLLRLSHRLTPDEAAKYETALKGIL